MNIYKFYFILNILLLFIETISIYMCTDELWWLIVMLGTLLVQIGTVVSANKTEKKQDGDIQF